MKDYTIMHACGLEEYTTTKRAAFAAARKHKRQCPLKETIYVDESKNQELTGTSWEF